MEDSTEEGDFPFGRLDSLPLLPEVRETARRAQRIFLSARELRSYEYNLRDEVALRAYTSIEKIMGGLVERGLLTQAQKDRQYGLVGIYLACVGSTGVVPNNDPLISPQSF